MPIVECILPDDRLEALQRFAEDEGYRLCDLIEEILEEFITNFCLNSKSEPDSVELRTKSYPLVEARDPVEKQNQESHLGSSSHNLIRALNIAGGFESMHTNISSLSLLGGLLSLPYSGATKLLREHGVDVNSMCLEIYDALSKETVTDATDIFSDLKSVMDAAISMASPGEEISTSLVLRAMMQEPQCAAFSYLASKSLFSEDFELQ